MRIRLALLTAGALVCLTSAALQGQEEVRPFQEQQGMVEMTMQVLGMPATMTLYFDRYGARQAMYVNMNMMGQNLETATIIQDGMKTTWDNTSRKGTRSVSDGNGGPMEMIASLTPERRRSLHYRTLKSKRLLGRRTTGFSIDSSGMKMSIWHWKGIPLLIEMNAMGIAMNITATRLDLKTPVDPSRFLVPDDVTITEGDEDTEFPDMNPDDTSRELPKDG